MIPPFTQSELHSILDYDPETGYFTRKDRGRGRLPDRSQHKRYVRVKVKGVSYKAHILAWFYVYGVWPQGQIDHIDRVPFNNAISNLREVSPLENAKNKSRGVKTDVPGVWHDEETDRFMAKLFFCAERRSSQVATEDL